LKPINQSHKTVGDSLETYVYGPQVAEFNKSNFESIYAIEEIDYEIVGKLTSMEFTSIQNFVKNSKTVKRKIRRALGAKI
jgi:hypothetical protein